MDKRGCQGRNSELSNMQVYISHFSSEKIIKIEALNFSLFLVPLSSIRGS